MTKKTIEALADRLFKAKPRPNAECRECDAEFTGWAAACRAVADVAGQLNPRFDRPYFLVRTVQGPTIKRMRGER